MSYSNQDVRREERERNQRERQQVSRHSQQRNEDSVPAPHQVSASLLFDTPIKKEKPDETSKMIEKTLGDFNQVSKYLMSCDHKQIIGISTHEIHKKNKMEGDKARIEQILKEMKGLPPITGLDDSDDHDNVNGILDPKPSSDIVMQRHQSSRRDERDHFLDERSSSGVSDDESSGAINTGYSHKSKGHQNRFHSGSNDWGSKRINEAVNQGSEHEPSSKRIRKTSESNLTSSRHPRNVMLNGRAENHRNKLNLSGNESSSGSSRSSSSESDSESGSSSASSDNESMGDVASHNMSGLEEGEEGDGMKTVDKHHLVRDGDSHHSAIDSNLTTTTVTAEADNPVESWNLMAFMQKEPSKNIETSPRREGTTRLGGQHEEEEEETADDKYTKTINKVAVGNFSSPLLSSPSSSESSGQDSPHRLAPSSSKTSSDSIVLGKQRKTNNSLSTSHSHPITSDIINKSSKQSSKGNEGKASSDVNNSSRSSEPTSKSTSSSMLSPQRLATLDCGPESINVRKADPSSKSKRSSLKVTPSKQGVPSKENHKPASQLTTSQLTASQLTISQLIEEEGNKPFSKENHKPTGQLIEEEGTKPSYPETVVPRQLICSIDCQMLKRIPRGLNIKKESSSSKKESSSSSSKKESSSSSKKESSSSSKKEFSSSSNRKEGKSCEKKHQRDSSGNPSSSPRPSSSCEKVSKTIWSSSTLFSPNESKSQQKSDIVSSPRVPPSATKKDPSPPLPLPAAVTSLAPSSTNRSHNPPTQTASQNGPSGLPFSVSGSIVPSEPSDDSNNQETSVEHCLANAKRLKHEADSENERTTKFCKYIESILFFILTASAKEIRADPRIEFTAMYHDTLKLLTFTTSNFNRGCSSTSSPSATDHKLLALSHCCQSLIQLKLYRLKSKERYENNRLIKDLKPNIDAKSGEVTLPTSSYLSMKKQLDYYQLLDSAFCNWAQVDSICQKHPSCKAFFDTLDKECTPLSITSSVDSLVTYVRTGLKILR